MQVYNNIILEQCFSQWPHHVIKSNTISSKQINCIPTFYLGKETESRETITRLAMTNLSKTKVQLILKRASIGILEQCVYRELQIIYQAWTNARVQLLKTPGLLMTNYAVQKGLQSIRRIAQYGTQRVSDNLINVCTINDCEQH